MPSAPVFSATGSSIQQIAADATNPALSPDGTKVAYYVPVDGGYQLLVTNLITGVTTLLSSRSDGTPGNGTSFGASFSADGNKVAFTSWADNLVAGDTNGLGDIFVKDLTTGTVSLVSTTSGGAQADVASSTAKISADGTRVVFVSAADNLVAGDTNNSADIFVKNLTTGTITRASTTSSGVEGNYDSAVFADISDDNTKVVFASSATNLVAGDSNGAQDIFVKNLTTGATTRISTDSAGQQLNMVAAAPSFSADGTKVVFVGTPFDTVPGDHGFRSQIYVKDLVTGALTLVSTNASGFAGDNLSDQPAISADGTKVIFMSVADNLVAGDANNVSDVFLKDLVTGNITLVSQSGAGVYGNHASQDPQLSDDGTRFVFTSSADNLVPGSGAYGIAVYAGTRSPYSNSGAVSEDHAVTATGKLGFSDADHGDHHTVTVAPPAAGTLGTLTATVSHDSTGTGLGGEVTWTYGVNNALLQGLKQDQTKLESFTINLNDGTTTTTQTVNVTIAGVNDAPVVTGAHATLAHGAQGVAYTVTAAQLLTGFTDVDGDTLYVSTRTYSSGSDGDNTYVVPVTANHGTVTENQNGTYTITPDGGYSGTMTLSYVVSDGYALVRSSITYVVDSSNSVFNGTANADYLFGTAGGDTLKGFGGNDYLDGKAGADLMIGSSGDDTYVVDDVHDVIVENASEGADIVYTGLSYTLGANLDNLWLTGTANSSGTGNALANVLFGNSGNNSIWGLDGNDFLDGKTGGDTLYGGFGDDGYVVDSYGDTVIEDSPAGGTDSIYTSVSFVLGYNLEYLFLTGTNTIDGTGNTLDNLLFGNDAQNHLSGLAGNDYIDGHGGADIMTGGTGDDGYYVDNSADLVVENSGEGYDTVYASATFVLGANVEKLSLQGANNINGTGNGLANVLSGNSGNNTLRALTGDDYLQGGAGADSFVFEAAATNGHDLIGDFTSGLDHLVFTGASYGFAAHHTLTAAEYSETGLAVGSSAQFIFDPTTGVLFWDTNGDGAGGQFILATLRNVPDLAVTDFDFT